MNKLLINKIKRANTNITSSWLDAKKWLWITHPVSQTLLWVTTILLGASSSLFSSKIIAFTLPFSEGAGASVNWYTVSFVMCVVFLALVFSISKWVTMQQDSYVIDSILTMPPGNFFDYLGREYRKVSELSFANIVAIDADLEELEEAIENDFINSDDKSKACIKNSLKNLDKSIALADEDIRRILDICINLMQMWDKNNTENANVVYRANVMRIYRFKDEHPQELMDKLGSLAAPYTVARGVDHYSGYIGILESTYSSTTDSSEPKPDSITPIAFPFTSSNEEDIKTILSPFKTGILGAPISASTQHFSYINDTQDIIKHYMRSGNMNEDVLNAIKNNYDESSKAESILSIPIFNVLVQGHYYVLNLYRNEKGLLYNGQKVRDFNNIILPLCALLAQTLHSVDDMKQKASELKDKANDLIRQ